MTKKLILFPDTNLFIQCKPLSEIDWSIFGDIEQIELIVSRPVQVEIDRQKSKGSGRLANRARIAASQFGEVLEVADGFLMVSDGKPTVQLFLNVLYKPDQELASLLNYEERDDQLVGIAAAYAKVNLHADVRVLTHDIGPRVSAKAVGVKCEKIRDEWLLPPETNEDEKNYRSLQAELNRYKNAEPCFELVSNNVAESAKKIFERTLIRYPALDDSQVQSLMKRVKENFPEATDFGDQNAEEAKNDASSKKSGIDLINSFNFGKKFIPASEKDISNYKRTLYPEWLSETLDLLRNLHIYLQAQSGWPILDIKLRNIGTRPAENALITFSALGNFKIKPTSIEDQEKFKHLPKIKKPPKAPTGIWRDTFSLAYDAFSRSNAQVDISSLSRNLGNLASLRPHVRDDEIFYYRPTKPKTFVEAFSLECVRWRHQEPAESFVTEVHVKLIDGEFKGAVDVKIHSSNMTLQFNKQVPFRIEIRQGNTLEEANKLVEQLLKPSVYRLNMPDS